MLDKKRIRQTKVKQRLSLSLEEYQSYSSMIMETLLNSSFFDQEKPLGIYVPIKQEVNTLPLIQSFLEKGISIALPKVEKDEMVFYYIENLDQLATGTFGVMEPQSQCVADSLSTLIVPLVAFNEKKERIGYGKGYYDRYLEKHPLMSIGVAFDFQKESFEGEVYDQPLDYIISEKKVYR